MSDTLSARPKILTTYEMVLIASFSAMIAVCSWITIPTIVPFTLQTFGVCCTAMTLGGKKGTFSVFVYIMLGLIGLPVFSGFKGGINALVSYSGGYITGFLFVPLVVWCAEKFFGKKLYIKIISMIIGLAVMYVFGTVWFMHITDSGVKYALNACVLPFLPFEAVKIVLSVIVSMKIKKIIKNI